MAAGLQSGRLKNRHLLVEFENQSSTMYDGIGDLDAYHLVRQHFDTLGEVIAQNSGAVVKTIGDAVMATFMNPLDAVRASIEMLQEIEEFNRTISGDLILFENKVIFGKVKK